MLKRLFLSVVLVGAGLAAGVVMTARPRSAAEPSASELALPTPSREPSRPAAAETTKGAAAPTTPAQPPVVAGVGGPDFTKVAGQAVKGVANISSLQVVRTPNSPFANDPFFRYFFGDDQFFGARDRRSLSLGSGVMISADGYVVTNNHVVGENVREITVALPDKREVHGTVIGADPATDIALLRIDMKGLPTIPWGDSSKLLVGEWVL